MRRYMRFVNRHISAHSDQCHRNIRANRGTYDSQMTQFEARRRQFHQLHASGCFVMPNPWDVGSARALAAQGFKALASTSAGFAWSIGRHDNGVTLDEAIAHL